MGKTVLNWIDRVLTFGMALCGFGACTSFGGEEYGCPTADYIFHGKVTDEAGTPLPDVKVSWIHTNIDGRSEENLNDTIYVGQDSLSSTDAKGEYSVRPPVDYWSSAYGFRFTDRDGASVDTFPNISDLAPLKGGDGRWYEGRSENTIDITLDIHVGK